MKIIQENLICQRDLRSHKAQKLNETYTLVKQKYKTTCETSCEISKNTLKKNVVYFGHRMDLQRQDNLKSYYIKH